MKRRWYELEYLDVEHKWLDGIKTTVLLVYYNELGERNVLAHVHTEAPIDVAKEHEKENIDMMLKCIRDNIN